MNAIVKSELDYFLSQKQHELDVTVAGMTALISDTDSKYESMKNQNWFKRVWNTVTIEDMKHNQAQLNAYCARVLTGLFERQRISEGIMINLGSQINALYTEHNALYASHLELKNALITVATKLNEKIDSVDNYHLLFEEITLDTFSGEVPSDLYRIMSLFDRHMINDQRKMDNIKKLLGQRGILTEKPVQIGEYLLKICETPDEYAGVVYMEANAHPDSFTSTMVAEVFERYHLLPPANRQFLKKDGVIKKILGDYDIDYETEFSLNMSNL
jgi:flagellar biosynthesis regulator FlaF